MVLFEIEGVGKQREDTPKGSYRVINFMWLFLVTIICPKKTFFPYIKIFGQRHSLSLNRGSLSNSIVVNKGGSRKKMGFPYRKVSTWWWRIPPIYIFIYWQHSKHSTNTYKAFPFNRSRPCHIIIHKNHYHHFLALNKAISPYI